MITISGEIHSSKNSRQIYRTGNGRPFIAKSRAAKNDEGLLALQLLAQIDEWERMSSGCKYPLIVEFYFRRRTNARWDFSNLPGSGCLRRDGISRLHPG